MIISRLNYKVKSILDYSPFSAHNSIGTEIARKWNGVLVSFHARKPFSDNEVLTVGTGFLIKIGNVYTLVTASHTITELLQFDAYFMRYKGENYSLNNLNIGHNAIQDYAFISIPEKMSNISLTYLPLDKRQDFIPTSTFMIFGFPTTKNKIDLRKIDNIQTCVNIVSHDFEYDTDTEDIHFPFNEKNKNYFFEPESDRRNLMSLRGMSGCPVTQILINENSGVITLRAIGIFKEQKNKREKKLVACTFTKFADELNSIIQSA
ncbi:serine protease [Yersinia alsatica]|uniref:serine protease n=1 Tax=Yersinia alsatica TaxID=2890317 RepID=UPI00119D515D|nr:serine protease [Yersinia alsatica]